MMRTRVAIAVVVASVSVLGGCGDDDAAPSDAADEGSDAVGEGTDAWYLGLPVDYASEGADEESDDPELSIYLTGADTVVVSALTPDDQPHQAVRYAVVPGPEATDESVTTIAAEGDTPELVSSIRMGELDVALISHVTIEYGVEANLLELEEVDGGGQVTTTLAAPDEFTAECRTGDRPALTGPALETPPPPGPPPGGGGPDGPPPGGPGEKTIYGWYLGMPVVPNVILPSFYGGTGPDAPADDVPDLHVYLTGPVDDQAPVGPPAQIPTAEGIRTLPPHQDTVDAVPTGDEPHDALGFFVVGGPEATEDNVHVQPDPQDSVPGAAMAYEIRIDDRWTKLDNHVTIEHGLATGLLELVPFEFGGLMWINFPDPTQIDVTCADTGSGAGDEVGQVTEGTIDVQGSRDSENSEVADGARTVEVSGRSFAYGPETITAEVGEDIEIVLTSSDAAHNFVIEEFDAFVHADSGDTTSGGFRAAEAGEFAFYCSIGGHRDAGMEGTLVVE